MRALRLHALVPTGMPSHSAADAARRAGSAIFFEVRHYKAQEKRFSTLGWSFMPVEVLPCCLSCLWQPAHLCPAGLAGCADAGCTKGVVPHHHRRLHTSHPCRPLQGKGMTTQPVLRRESSL